MIEGQKVVCINDSFPDWAKAMYNQLPEKDKTYTIRKVSMGVSPVVVDPSSKGSTPVFHGTHEVSLLLVELNNPIHETSKQEMGFMAERFKPIDGVETISNKDIKQPEPVKISKPKQQPVLV